MQKPDKVSLATTTAHEVLEMDKKKNAQILDPNRFKIAQQNAVIPGGPQNNNPMNVTDVATPPIQAQSIYGDHNQQYAQMGTGMVNPQMVGPSGLQQNFPAGQRLNSIPFNLQKQPDTSGVSMMPDGMESGRLAGEAGKRGVPAGPMGLQGMPAIPGNMPDNPAFSGPPMMQGMPSAEQATGMNTKTGKRGK